MYLRVVVICISLLCELLLLVLKVMSPELHLWHRALSLLSTELSHMACLAAREAGKCSRYSETICTLSFKSGVLLLW